MDATARLDGGFSASELACSGLGVGLRPLHAAMVSPAPLFLVTLAIMLFRPPDVHFYALDRVAFALLLLVVFLRAMATRQSLRVAGPVTWPMLGLVMLTFWGVATQPYDPLNWSLFAAKWAVPFALYHVAGLVFDNEPAERQFEIFCLAVLAYLSFTAICFLVGATGLIFPQFILDESLGMHADRARGPFLQAVANGVTLNLLGLLALNAYRRARLRGWLAAAFLLALPLAILATKTRAVWLSCAGSVLGVFIVSPGVRLRKACLALAGVCGAGLLIAVGCDNVTSTLSDRLQDRSPVEYRMAVYEAGWGMFIEKPITGWGEGAIQPELEKRISAFHPEAYVVHNTYLEVLVTHGLIGLGLYLWIIVDLFRLGRRASRAERREVGFLDRQFRSVWPFFVLVYLVNACFVVMNYQFVSGLLFTVAGMLAAQNRRVQMKANVAAS